jgi:hypothetical protein
MPTLIVALVLVGSVAPQHDVAQAKREWLKELRAAAASGDRATRFPSPTKRVLLGRLHRVNHSRAPHVGGGQWAASEGLYPYPHS